MKAKIHIDIGQFEFVEFELTNNFSNQDDYEEALKDMYKRYHKMGDKVLAQQSVEEAKKRIERPKDINEDDKLSAITPDE